LQRILAIARFWNSVQRTSISTTARFLRIDGFKPVDFVMAHEIGHLLLGENSHSTRIMTDPFSRADFEGAERGKLLYIRLQAETMQERVLQTITRRS